MLNSLIWVECYVNLVEGLLFQEEGSLLLYLREVLLPFILEQRVLEVVAVVEALLSVLQKQLLQYLERISSSLGVFHNLELGILMQRFVILLFLTFPDVDPSDDDMNLFLSLDCVIIGGLPCMESYCESSCEYFVPV